jgi:secernin
MELLRFGLERASTAQEALQEMTRLVSAFGQGRCDGCPGSASYDNIYMIADANEAFVLLTAGYEWAWERVKSSTLSISNIGQVGVEADSISPTAHTTAIALGLWNGTGAFPGFASVYGNSSAAQSGRQRQARSSYLLQSSAQLSIEDMMDILSDHGVGNQPRQPTPRWSDDQHNPELCAHGAGPPPSAEYHTAASLVADLPDLSGSNRLPYNSSSNSNRLPVFFHSLSNPCSSIFYPVFPGR